MTNTKFRTKIIYLVIIAVLIGPLFLLGRPSSVQKGEEGQVTLNGGILAGIREKENIVDAQLGEIDPGSSTMKLATFGMRGVALALLWNKSLEYEKKFDWNNVVVTSKQITMLEPRFISVWDYLSWRLAYNGSANQDDYRERYHWVIRGFEFLEEGTHYNAKAPFLYHKAGWTISQKIGIADEKVQYRQLFREDDEFHFAHHTPSIADRDNWLFGIPWYKKAEDLFLKVENDFLEKKAANLINDDQTKEYYQGNKKTNIGGMSRPLFLVHSRMNLIHYADWYEQDGSFGEKAQYNWRTAESTWDEFGDIVITTTIDDRRNPGSKRVIYLKEAAEAQANIDALNEELVGLLAPRTKKDLYIDRWNSLTELEQAAIVDLLQESTDETYIALREYLDETRPDWEKELTDLLNSMITEPDEQAAYRIPEPIRMGNRGMEQSDERDEVNMAQKASRAITEMSNQVASSLVLNPQSITAEIGKMERQQREDYQKYLAALEENPELKDDPNFPVVEQPATRNAQRAREIEQQIENEKYRHQLADMFCDLTNYVHYGQQTSVEQTQEAIDANEQKFIARRAFNEEGNVYAANEHYLESMRIWNQLMDKPQYEFLNNELFRRNYMEFVDRFRHVTDKLDDSERGNLYPEEFPFEHVVLREFEFGPPVIFHEALLYLRKCHENGDYDEVVDRSQLLINAWYNFMMGHEYLFHVPVQQYKDEVVETFALYVDALQNTGREYNREVPLIDFINTVMYYDSMTREAIYKTEAINNQTDEASEALLSQLTDAAFDWNLVIAQFPVLKLSPDVYVDQTTNLFGTSHLRNAYEQITMITTIYVDACRQLNRPVTKDFPLYYMLPEGIVVDTLAVTVTSEAPVPDTANSTETLATEEEMPLETQPDEQSSTNDAASQESLVPTDEQNANGQNAEVAPEN